ncbi:probable mediator of RNA polymerase II transcription subunit 26c isoform X2 [Jatropha curcas]|uniref:probable mediator of RNA polymerase II transcription subunit 26c isoform X2 n=1 Tax=Jatropha curcas TaxID=180498 RepID=UPI0005FB0CA4|nr:probable mediator of RNA polymerase II transcription subunit 26c isoform X2 [Jatropha curcas]
MDIDDFRSILESSGVDVWTFIETAIMVASSDFGSELKRRRDKIVEMLYSSSDGRCRNCDFDVGRINDGHEMKESSHEAKVGGGGGSGSPSTTPRSIHGEEEEEEEEDDELDPYGGLLDDEQKKILEIKQSIEDPDQSEDSLIDLLQSLADMDITFRALKETDIGRHVNRLRKHSSNDVRKLVKQLVRKWKEIVDEWVRLNPQGEHASSALMADGDSPQQKIPQNGHHQVPDFAYSPNPHNGSSGSDKNNSEPERKPKPVPRKEAPPRPIQQSASASHNAQRQREQQQSNFDSERLASARKRLQENYKEALNAKKQRTIQVMDIHEIPKPKNTFFSKNKGGASQGRHW